MPAYTPLNDQTRVNTVTAGQQYDAAIAPLAAGGFVVIWDDNTRQEVYGQLYDAAGNKVGGEFQVDTTTTGTQFFPTVSALEGGGFVVAWQSGTLANANIYARRYDSAGNALGNDFLVNTVTTAEQLNARVTGLAGGGFVVTWDTISSGQFQDVRGQIYNAAGATVGAEFVLNTVTADQQGLSTLAPLGTGFVAIYQSNTPSGSNNSEILGQRFDASGQMVGAEFQVNTTTAGSQYGSDVVKLADGGFLVTWTDPTTDRIMGRRYDSNGVATTGEIIVATVTAPQLGGTSVTALADGGWLVSWVQGDGTTNKIFARAFSAGNSAITDIFQVSQNTTDFPVQTTNGVSTLTNGRVVFAWDGPATPTDQDIYIRLYQIASTPGDSGDNTINGTSDDDVIYGLGGNDTLNGLAGNDMIDGGTGTDQMSGGTGNDTFHADTQSDVIFEGVDGGTDSVVATSSFYLYANVENLTLAGAGDFFGVGNGLANVITGNTGSNLLIGGDGNDTLHGGAGVDSLFGEAGADTINGDAGVDYLVGGIGDDTLNGGADGDAVYGEDGNDSLTGGTGFVTDILVGGAGNDTLYANSGANDYDRIDGGAGDDTYYVDTGDDLTFEAVGGGTDTVYADVSNVANAGVYLYANVENLVLVGTTAFGVGNELANTLTGSNGANWLLGGAGNDTINGKSGNDVFFGEAGSDIFVFELVSGADVIGDFNAAEDTINLDAYNFASFTALQASFVQNGAHGAINLGGGNLIVLHNVTMASLDAGDFVL